MQCSWYIFDCDQLDFCVEIDTFFEQLPILATAHLFVYIHAATKGVKPAVPITNNDQFLGFSPNIAVISAEGPTIAHSYVCFPA